MTEAGRLFVISGPSGSGKSSIITEVLDLADIDFSISATTRLPRPGEVNGTHYNFVSRHDFEQMIEDGELLEWAEYNNHLYGTPAKPIAAANEIGRDVLLDIEIKGARQVKDNRPDSIMVFISPPSMEELERRLRNRGDTSDEDIEDRLEIASEQMAIAEDLFDHIVVNDSFTKAVDEVLRLITDES
ncbi:MAG: guanylate kinase [Actinobacteria bacterium]|nr:MAG: guanylate kinase [Actinomycetota bacterium]REK39015.1 MAG: guanylate kinase [Actinomycetota bacterium]